VADSSPANRDEVDFGQLAERARQMRQQLERTAEDLKRSEVQGLGGGGLVRATVSGEHTLLSLTIDSSVIDPDDPQTLSEMVCEAVNDATAKLLAQRSEQVSAMTGGLAGMFDGVRARPPRVAPMTAPRRLPPRSDGPPRTGG